jgi:hypothetical protein
MLQRRGLIGHQRDAIDHRPAMRRCDAVGRTVVATRLGPGFGARLGDHREAEIEQLRATVVGEDRVGRLDIAVEDAAPVGRREPTRQVECDSEHLAPRQRSVDLVERLALHILRHQIRVAGEL